MIAKIISSGKKLENTKKTGGTENEGFEKENGCPHSCCTLSDIYAVRRCTDRFCCNQCRQHSQTETDRSIHLQ